LKLTLIIEADIDKQGAHSRKLNLVGEK